MKTLLVYDDTGFIIHQETAEQVRVPLGIQHLVVDLPIGKQVKITDGIGVDTSTTPHKVTFENIPKDKTEMTVEQLQKQLQFVTLGLLQLTQDVNELKVSNNDSSDIINQLANLLSTIKAGA